MPKVHEMARITVVSGEIPADEVAQAAWMLWSSVRREIDNKRLPSMASAEGVAGNRLDGSLVKHIMDLWPEYHGWEPEAQRRFAGSLYSYLKSTNNAHCLVPSKTPIWWISSFFNKVAVQKVFGGSSPRSREQARQEKKLTPHEAGEDRAPAPVTITIKAGKVVSESMAQAEPVPQPPQRVSDALQSVQEMRRTERERRRAATLDALTNMKEPATAEEIGKALAKNGFTSELSTVRTDLNYLSDQKLAFYRVETRDERTMRAGGVPQKAQRARLFWPTEPVPDRTLREIVPGFVVVNRTLAPPDTKARYKVAVALWKLVRRAPFSAVEVAEDTGIAVGTVRHYFTEFARDGLITQVDVPKGKPGLQKFYRVNRAKEDQVREAGRRAQEKLSKNGNGRKSPTVVPAPVATPAVAPQTDAERNAIRIIEVIQEEGTQRENVLMAKADLDRDPFNQAIELLIAGEWLKRFEVNGQTFYGAEAPVISNPPPSVATAKISQLEASVDLEEGLALIRKAFESRTATPDPRVAELEAEIADLRNKLRKSQAALTAALEG